jgi:hypothetical protein
VSPAAGVALAGPPYIFERSGADAEHLPTGERLGTAFDGTGEGPPINGTRERKGKIWPQSRARSVNDGEAADGTFIRGPPLGALPDRGYKGTDDHFMVTM